MGGLDGLKLDSLVSSMSKHEFEMWEDDGQSQPDLRGPRCLCRGFLVIDEADARVAVRVVLDGLNLTEGAALGAAEVDDTVAPVRQQSH